MAGYDYESWKSNNALEAESNGLLTAGRLAKRLGVTTAAVQARLYAAEKHHVSGAYNLVGYYDPERVSDSDLRLLREYDADRLPHSLLSATVKWLEWPQMKVGRYARRGRSARPTERCESGCRVTFQSAATLEVTFPDGTKMTKRRSTKGLEVIDELDEANRAVVDGVAKDLGIEVVG